MKRLCILFGAIALSFCSAVCGYDQNTKGWYYPTGTSSNFHIASQGGWLYGWPTYPEYGYKAGTFHIGDDVMGSRAGESTDIVNIADGVVKKVKPSSSYGTGNGYIILEHKYYDSNGNIQNVYALHGHGLWTDLSQFSVGEEVKAGTKLATMGYWVHGKHDHFGLNVSGVYSNGFAFLPADAKAWWNTDPAERSTTFRQPTASERKYFVDPFAFIESHTPYNWLDDDGGDDTDDGAITPPPSTGQASLATLEKTDQGEGYWSIVPTCEDSSGTAGGVRSIHLWLHMRTHTPEVWIDLGKQFSPGNPSRWSTEFIYDIFTHFEEGVYEIYVETEGGNGQLLMQYGGKNIDVNRSTQPPVKINSSARQVSASQVDVMLHGQAEQGRRFMSGYEVHLIAGDRSIVVTSANVSRNTDPVNLSFNPQSFGLYPGDYQLAYRLVDVWGTATGVMVLPHWINVSVEMNWYYAVDLNGQIAVRRQMPDGSWMSWASVDGGLANIDVTRAGDYQVIVGSDPNGGIWTRRADGRGLSGWLHHDGAAIYGPSVVEHNGVVYLLVVGTDHALYIRYTRDGLTWSSGWYGVSDGRLYQSVVGASFEGNIHLFGVDAVGNCYRTIWDTVNQPRWTKFDGTVNYALSVTRLGSQLLVLAAAGDSLYTRVYQNSWFTSNWQNLDGAARADPDMSTYGGQATIGVVGMGLPLYFRTLSTGWQGWGGTYRDVALCDGRAW